MNISRGVYPRKPIRSGYIHIESFDEIDFDNPVVVQSLASFYLKLIERQGNVQSSSESSSITTQMGNTFIAETDITSAANYVAAVA
jgi:hypothetical protein